MRKEAILTRKIAEQFLAESNSVNLSDFSSMEDAAAHVLAEIGPTALNGLTSLSPTVAEILARSGGLIELSGLTNLSDATAHAFAGKSGWLRLNGLTSLSDAAAPSLAQFDGQIELKALTSLSDAAAQALAKHSESLWLDGLASLSDKAATALGKHKGENLSLSGLTSLSDTAAQALSRHASGVGGGLCLDGLKSLSDVAAKALAQHKNTLSLAGLTELTDLTGPALADNKPDKECRTFQFNLNNITAGVLVRFDKHIPKGLNTTIELIGPDMGDDIADVLAKSDFDEISFMGLATLTDSAAEALSQFEGDISFWPYSSGASSVGGSWLKTLSTRAAVALSKHKRFLSFNATSIILEPAAAAALLRHPHLVATPFIKSYLKRRTKPRLGSNSTQPEDGRNTVSALRKRKSG